MGESGSPLTYNAGGVEEGILMARQRTGMGEETFCDTVYVECETRL